MIPNSSYMTQGATQTHLELMGNHLEPSVGLGPKANNSTLEAQYF